MFSSPASQRRAATALPGNNAFPVRVSSGRTAVGEECQPDDFRSPLGNCLRTAMSVKVGGGIAGVGGVDLDWGIAKLVGELYGKHVERSLRGVIAQELGANLRIVRVAVQCQGTESAGHVDDARRRCLAEHRKHRLGYGDSAKEIRAEGGLDGVEAAGGRKTVVFTFEDACVVDEYVKPAELIVDGLSRRLNGSAVGEIHEDELRVDAFGGQFGDGLLTGLLVARADEDGCSRKADLARDFQAEALVCSRDERDFRGGGAHGKFSPCSFLVLQSLDEESFSFGVRIMKAAPAPPYQPRKTPLQERSAITVEAIAEATIQVLLAVGRDRLTTTRVAERAGVSVGTLYQYYPNKQSLLFALLEDHMDKVSEAVEMACGNACGKPLLEMVKEVVQSFVDAKLARTDISMALYQISADIGGPAIVKRMVQRSRKALGAMIQTATDIASPPGKFAIEMMFAAMAGATRSVLEAGASPPLIPKLRDHLVLLCQTYMVAVAAATLQCDR